MRAENARPGSTLIELLIVLIVLSVMVAVATPAFRIDSLHDAERVSIAALRARALSEGRDVELTYAFEGRSLTVTARPNGLVVIESTGVVSFPRLRKTNAD